MKNKKGFTLVELLAVITILGIIIAMVVINANYFSSQRQEKDYLNIVNIIEENTKVLVNTNVAVGDKVNENLLKLMNSSEQVQACKINYNVLVENNLMDADTKNPKNNKIIDNKSYIKVSLNSDNEYKYEFVYVENTNNENLYDCLTTNDIAETNPQENVEYIIRNGRFVSNSFGITGFTEAYQSNEFGSMDVTEEDGYIKVQQVGEQGTYNCKSVKLNNTIGTHQNVVVDAEIERSECSTNLSVLMGQTSTQSCSIVRQNYVGQLGTNADETYNKSIFYDSFYPYHTNTYKIYNLYIEK